MVLLGKRLFLQAFLFQSKSSLTCYYYSHYTTINTFMASIGCSVINKRFIVFRSTETPLSIGTVQPKKDAPYITHIKKLFHTNVDAMS